MTSKGRLTPVHWKQLVSVFVSVGFSVKREKGDHVIIKASTSRIIVFKIVVK